MILKRLIVKSCSTQSSFAPLFMRLALGIMILPHGLQKVFGLWGGHGFANTLHFFTEQMGIPWILGVAAILAEFLGGIGLIAGLFTRFAAFNVGMVMLVAAITVHLKYGFFMNWFGTKSGEGIEFFILAIGLALGLIITGGGRFAADSLISRKYS
ncbi:MAG: DoxX family protein [Nitrospinota bacterium]